jgi:glycosyltransferase involved in cell wall biosynthesis
VRERYRAWAPAERLVTVPGAIDLAAISRFRASFRRREERRARGISDEAELVLGLGTLFVHKGAPLLVQCFAVIAGERPQARLALVGARADELAVAVGRYVAEHGLGDRVRVEPMGDEAYDWLAMADLMVCNSDRESMPRVVLEAMAFEVPVLATTVGDVPAVIADGESGWLIPHSDPAALRRGLLRALAASREERRTISAAAARRVAARDAPLAAARFAAVLRAVLEGRPLTSRRQPA